MQLATAAMRSTADLLSTAALLSPFFAIFFSFSMWKGEIRNRRIRQAPSGVHNVI